MREIVISFSIFGVAVFLIVTALRAHFNSSKGDLEGKIRKYSNDGDASQDLPPLDLPPLRLPPRPKSVVMAHQAPPDTLVSLDVEYADANGEITQRRIHVLEVEPANAGLYIRAWCELRDDLRTFRADRIISARQANTSAEIVDPEIFLLDLLPEHARPDPEHDAFMERARPGLMPLVWIASANREIASEEMEILLNYLRAYASLSKKSFEMSQARASAFIEGLQPTITTAIGELSKLSPNGRIRPLIEVHAALLRDVVGEGNDGRYRRIFKLRS